MRPPSASKPLISIISLASLAAAACESGESGEDLQPRPVHAAFEIAPGPDSEDGETWYIADDVLRGVIVLDLTGPSGDGERMHGILALTADGASRVEAIEATYEDGVIAIDEGTISEPSRGGRLAWERFELFLDDTSGDGILDSGAGALTGELDFFFEFAYITDGAITAFADSGETGATIRSTGFVSDEAFPYDDVRTRFDKPVIADALDEELVLLVDGERAQASVSASGVADMPALGADGSISLATGATISPELPIPLGSELRLDTSGLADVSGFDVNAPDTLEAAPDLGSALDNLNFDGELEGWHAIGNVELLDELHGAEPEIADTFLTMQDRSQLVAALELPEDADAISLRAIGFSQYGGLHEGAIAVDIVRPNGETVSEQSLGSFSEEELIHCEDDDCHPFPYRSEPQTLELNVSEAAGERAFLRITVNPDGFFGTSDHLALSPPPRYAAALEDLQLRLEDSAE